MWVCSHHPLGVHHVADDEGAHIVTIPLDGTAACDCDAYAELAAVYAEKRPEWQPTCPHIAQVMANHCGWRSDYDRTCGHCGRAMIRIEDVIPGWVGEDRSAIVNDLLRIRKELDETTE